MCRGGRASGENEEEESCVDLRARWLVDLCGTEKKVAGNNIGNTLEKEARKSFVVGRFGLHLQPFGNKAGNKFCGSSSL